jgi:hypothetical protein
VLTEAQWRHLDEAASGLVYGAIVVLAVLMATKAHLPEPLEAAAIVFGSTLAISLAKAFSLLLSQALETGERITRHSWREVWLHASPTLAVANLPTLLFVAASFGWLTAAQAVAWSQGLCVVIMLVIGARVGWVLDRRAGSALLGGVFAGGVGLGLALMKYVIH